MPWWWQVLWNGAAGGGPLMRRTMREFNNTEPGIVNDPQFVRVSFRLDQDSETG